LANDRRRIWIVTARVGNGHVQAAKAVAEALTERGLGDHVAMIDTMEVVPGWFRRLYAGGYTWMATRAPGLFGRLYDQTDRAAGPWPNAGERLRVRLESRMIAGLRERLNRERPDVVLHTHFLAPAVMGRWIEEDRLSTRQGVVVTDFHPHRVWLARPVERYFVAIQAATERLAQRGVAADAVCASGIPIMAKHRVASEAARAFADFDWPVDRPVILLVSGADFVVGPLERVVDALLAAHPEATLQVTTGRNAELQRRLEARRLLNPNLRVIGFCDRLPEMFSNATVVLSKTGGITTSECLARGAAMVALFPVPGQEERNADYLLSHGAGLKVTQVGEVVLAVGRLLADRGELIRMRAAAQALGRPDAAGTVADWLMECVELAKARSHPSREMAVPDRLLAASAVG